MPQILAENVQLVEFPTNITGSTLEDVYARKSFLEDYKVEILILNTYFSDHEAVRVKISKKDIDLMIFWFKIKKTAVHLEYFYNYFSLSTYIKCGFNNINRIWK